MANDCPPLSRRAVLHLCGSSLLAGSAGCSQLNWQSPKLDIFVGNQTDQSYRVPVSLYEWQSSEARNGARDYQTTFELAADEDVHREAVADIDSYVVRYGVYRDGSRLVDRGHTHCYPDENGEIVLGIEDDRLIRLYYRS